MENKVKIEPYTDMDQAHVAELIVHIQQQEYQIPITLEQQPDLLDIPGFYQQNCGGFWTAHAEGRIVGTIALLDIGNQQAALRKMFVQSEYRGKIWNTASLLLEQALSWAEQQHLQDIYLGTTLQFTAAHRFYEKNNFTSIDITELPDSFPVMAVDKKFYHLALNTAR